MIDFLKNDIKSVLLMITVPLIFVAFLIPTIKKVAEHVGALDIPNQRKVHSKPIPRLGGLGIFLGFLAGYMTFCEPTVIMNSILIGSFIIILTGILDDIRPLKAKHKFLAQICACLVVIIYGGVLLKDVGAFGFHINFGIFAYPITLFFMLGCINCINLIDGLDGLAGGIASIFFLTIAVIAYVRGINSLAFIISLIMLGSTLGFLIHNFHPAKIFMGDTGSMFLGFIISVITLLGFKTTLASSIIIPMFVLVIPIFDTLCAIIRRKLKGESISTPDKQHFHHQLLRRDCSQVKTVLIIYAITILFSSASVIYVLLDRKVGYIVYGILLLILLLVSMFKTDIIFDKNIKINNIFNSKSAK